MLNPFNNRNLFSNNGIVFYIEKFYTRIFITQCFKQTFEILIVQKVVIFKPFLDCFRPKIKVNPDCSVAVAEKQCTDSRLSNPFVFLSYSKANSVSISSFLSLRDFLSLNITYPNSSVNLENSPLSSSFIKAL